MSDAHEGRRDAVRSTGSPDPNDPAGPLDTRVDPSIDEASKAAPDSSDVTEASEESFPASDPPTWTDATWSARRRTGQGPGPSDQSPS
jgi:hypothetical protein